MRLTKAEVEEAIATIFGKLSEGKSDKEAIEEMGISAEEYAALKAAMFDAKADEIRTRPIEHVYVEYLINQLHNVKDLTGMVADFKTTKQYNAMVGAVRARSEIYDKLIKTGQDMGLLKREAVRHEVVGGIVVAELTNEKLRTLITQELSELNKLMKRYGEKGIMEMEPGSLHYGPALPARKGEAEKAAEEDDGEAALAMPAPKPEATSPLPVAKVKSKAPVVGASGEKPEAKHYKAATSKVHAGRRVVKS